MNKIFVLFLLSVSIPFLLSHQEVFAANILFVSDSISDSVNIPSVLNGDGHTVTVVTNDYSAGSNPTLAGSINSYDSIFWSATGTGFGSIHNDANTFTNLNNYVLDGGCVYVTGYDTVASPNDNDLYTFVGGSGSLDFGTPMAIINVPNALTVGVVDIRGVTPTGGFSDMDRVVGALAADTVGVVPANLPNQWSWTLKDPAGPSGVIAYVSNGAHIISNAGEHPSWLDTSAGGAGAYNAALRNFALTCESEIVGGEILSIDNTALMLAGLQSSTIWMLPVLAGAAGVGAFYIKTRMNKD